MSYLAYMARRRVCTGTTLSGRPCGATAVSGEDLCFVHGHRAKWEELCRAKHANHRMGMEASRARRGWRPR